MAKRIIIAGLAVLGVFGSPVLAAPQDTPSAFIKAVDKDGDGTISLDEVKAYAAERFKSLEKDSDGTLDAEELKDRISAGDFKAANSDGDKTIDQAEFTAYVEKLFKDANDGDDTLDAKELASPAGKKLIALLR